MSKWSDYICKKDYVTNSNYATNSSSLDCSACSDEDKHLDISESLILGYDSSADEIPCLSVSRYDGSRIQVLNTIHGKMAVNLYYYLTGKTNLLQS